MTESIREKIIGRLTNYRQLSSTEMTELDVLAVALDLDENDPFWGQIAWAWAILPRKEDQDIAMRALGENLRQDFEALLAAHQPAVNSIGESDDAKIEELALMIKALADKPVASAAPASINPKMLHDALVSALSKQKSIVSKDEMLSVIREIVSWVNAGVAAVAIGICLFIGFQYGEHVQSGHDEQAMAKMERQIADLTAALPKR